MEPGGWGGGGGGGGGEGQLSKGGNDDHAGPRGRDSACYARVLVNDTRIL